MARAAGITCSLHAEQPALAGKILSVAQDTGQTLLLIGQLHYRSEPLARVEGRVEERLWAQCLQEDAALALALYRLGGRESLCRLEGDFALVCADRQTQRLVAVRDPMGAYPLFWLQQGDTLALSSSIRPLVDLLPAVELDTEFLVEYLAFPTEVMSELPLTRTAYRGVQRLRSGCWLEARLTTRQVTCQTYWRWPEQIRPVSVDSMEEAGALVRDRLQAAVRERQSRHASTASHFSGGYDSTGVALLASRLTPPGRPLHALSLVYQRDPMLAQERDYIEAALAAYPDIVSHAVPADDLLDFDAHQQVPLLDEPSPHVGRWHSLGVLSQVAAAAGADTVMTGDGADHLFVPMTHARIAELVTQGRWRQAWRLATRYSHASSRSLGGVIGAALQSFVPLRLRDGLGPLLHGGRAPFATLSERTIPPWLSEQVTQHYRLRQRILERQMPLSRHGFVTGDSIAYVAGDWCRWYAGLPYGVVMCRPYFDPRLVVLALGLPHWVQEHLRPMKPVLAAALHDVLPEAIVWRQRKVHFGVLLGGLARHRAALEALMQQPSPADGMLRLDVLRDSLEQAAVGAYTRIMGVCRLKLALSYLLWMSQRAAWQQRPAPTIGFRDLADLHPQPAG